MATYKNMRLYAEIKAEMATVIEAEEASKAWKQEARFRMKDVNTLISAARKVNKGMEINVRELVEEIREELAADAEEAAAYEEEPAEETPNAETAE